jgi:hypothetical protein
LNAELAFTVLLALEALACLWLAYVAWRETAGQNFLFRSIGCLLWCLAAAVILYGISRS